MSKIDAKFGKISPMALMLVVSLFLEILAFVSFVPTAEASFSGNLRLTNETFYPIQVVKEASALVHEKLTLIEIFYDSTFTVPVTTDIIVRINGIERARGKRTLKPGVGGEKLDDDEGGWVPPKDKPFSSEIVSPQVVIEVIIVPVPGETNPLDNVAQRTFKVKITRNPSGIWVTVGRKVGDTPAALDPMYSNSIEFMKGTYPVTNVMCRIEMRALFFPGKNVNQKLTDFEMIQLFDKLSVMKALEYRCDFAIGYVKQGWIDDNYDVVVKGQKVSCCGLRLPWFSACLSEDGRWVNPAHEVGHILADLPDPPPPHPLTVRYWIEKEDLQTPARCFMGSVDKEKDKKTYTVERGQPAWICNPCYEKLLTKLKVPGQDPEVLFIRGIIFRNGTTVLDNWYRLPYGYPDIPLGATGNYTIKFLDVHGGVINQTGFNATFGIEALGVGTMETNVTGFAFKIPWVDGTSQIQIQNATGYVLATKNVSANPPTVNVTYPNGGEVLRPETTHNITWEASDPDGDPLTYTVLTSQDGGASWTSLDTDIQEKSYAWNITGFSFGDNYLVKVIATDGVNTGQDVSDNNFTVDTTYFTVEAAPTNQWILPGGTAYYNVTATSFGGWNGTVTLNATVLPYTPNITLSWPNGNILSLPPNGSATTTLIANATNSTQPGIYTLVINGTGSLIDVCSVSLIIEKPVRHDVAITSVTPCSPKHGLSVVTECYSTWTININITVENEGDFIESFTVEGYYGNATGNYTIGATPVTLAPRASTTKTFTWDVPLPAWVWPYWTFTLYANVSVVAGETDTADNIRDGAIVRVRWLGDATGDGWVNIFDLTKLALSWNKPRTDPRYNPLCDFAKDDGIINIYDLTKLALQWRNGPRPPHPD